MRTFIRFAVDNGFKPFGMSSFMKSIRLPRTAVYSRFANIREMIEFYYTGFVCVVAEYMTDLIFSPIDELEARLLPGKDEGYEFVYEAFKNPENERIFMEFFASVYRIAVKKCFRQRQKRTGEILTGERSELFKLYICFVLRSVRYYLIDFDKKTFLSEIRAFREQIDPEALTFQPENDHNIFLQKSDKNGA